VRRFQDGDSRIRGRHSDFRSRGGAFGSRSGRRSRLRREWWWDHHAAETGSPNRKAGGERGHASAWAADRSLGLPPPPLWFGGDSLDEAALPTRDPTPVPGCRYKPGVPWAAERATRGCLLPGEILEVRPLAQAGEVSGPVAGWPTAGAGRNDGRDRPSIPSKCHSDSTVRSFGPTGADALSILCGRSANGEPIVNVQEGLAAAGLDPPRLDAGRFDSRHGIVKELGAGAEGCVRGELEVRGTRSKFSDSSPPGRSRKTRFFGHHGDNQRLSGKLSLRGPGHHGNSVARS